MLGNSVFSEVIINKKLSIDYLIKGIYFLNIEGYRVSKFIKK